MKKTLLKFIIAGLMAAPVAGFAQVYVDGFTQNGTTTNAAPYWGTGPGYTVTHIDNTTTTNITGNGTSPAFTTLFYGLNDNPQMAGIGSNTGSGNPISSINMTGNTNIYVIARTLTGTPALRLSIKDVNGYTSDFGTITEVNTLSSTSAVYTYSYTAPQDAFSFGPPCSAGSPCNLDLTQIASLLFSINAATGGYIGTVIIDYVQIGGTAPTIPNITIDSPTTGSLIGASSTITASTTSPNVQSVTFFDGTTPLGTDITSPYSYNWTGASEGAHTLTAVVSTNNGIANTSTPVSVSVAATEPTVAATAISFTGTSNNSMTVSWTNGNGAKRFVIVRAGSDVNIAPTDGVEPTANAAFGSGAEIGTGNFLVYASTGNSVTITGLSSSTTYFVRVYEYNGTGVTSNTLTSAFLSGNQITTTVVNADAFIQSKTIYPNPATDKLTIEMELKKPSSVRIALTDMVGREKMELVNLASATSVSAQKDISTLSKGTYIVTYIIDGTAAKSELVMIK